MKQEDKDKKIALVAGAGPAGLTAAYELLKKSDIQPVVVEATNVIGGISQTVKYKGNRMDIGGHRFFSKSSTIMEWWNNVMPIQGKNSNDDILLGNNSKPMQNGGPDPETSDRVMLYRDRVSRIFFLRKFFDYPISLKFSTFANMGLWRTIKSGVGYIYSQLFKREENSLENFYINRFGRPLYNLFFEGYTEKLWGIHPSKLAADWGSQRVKGLSIYAVLKDALTKPFMKDDIEQKKVETSLIEQFIYPKLGPGQLWEIVADDIDKMKIKNETKIKTYAGRVPDTWIYIQERDVKVGRLQVFNNWSPYLVEDYENKMFIGLEYFCNEGDELWTMDDDSFIKMAIDELVKIDIIEPDAVLDATRVKIKKAYPAYFGSYYSLDKVRKFLDTIENLYCLGRNGQHRYNNMDHSMMTAMVAVDNITQGNTDKSAIWNVNTENEYHEEK